MSPRTYILLKLLGKLRSLIQCHVPLVDELRWCWCFAEGEASLSSLVCWMDSP